LADSIIPANWAALLAQAAGGGAGGGGVLDLLTGGGMMVPLVLTMLLMYFLLMRPEQKKRKQLEQVLSNLKKNDHVVTVGGIFGTVVSTSDAKAVVIRIDDSNGTKVKVLRSAISYVGGDEPAPEGKAGA
jgi:preprotein translocase subunit YajC